MNQPLNGVDNNLYEKYNTYDSSYKSGILLGNPEYQNNNNPDIFSQIEKKECNEEDIHFNHLITQTKWKITSPCICYPFCCFKRNCKYCSCCNNFVSPCITVEGKHGERAFWGFLELDLCGPSFAIILIILAHIVFSFTVLTFAKKEYSSNFSYFIIFITFFLLFMFLWSFFMSACSDPGFLPYDLNFELKSKSHHQNAQFDPSIEKVDRSDFIIPKVGWRRQLNGLAIWPDQVEFAKSNCPPFATFSRSAGRFVVRADHICGWTGNWIGKRNHKQFILMTFWGTFMIVNLFCWQLKFARLKTIDNDGSKSFKYLFSLGLVGFLVQLFAILLEPIFFFLFLIEFIQSILNIIKNTTRIKKWKKSNRNQDINEITEINCMKSMKEIFGNSFIFCWIFPFSAFDDNLIINNEDILIESPQIMN